MKKNMVFQYSLPLSKCFLCLFSYLILLLSGPQLTQLNIMSIIKGLSIIYGVVKFNTYESLRKWFYTHHPTTTTTPLHRKTAIDFLCGSVAGVMTTAACHPLDVVRTRLVSQELRLYRGTYHAMRMMIEENGLRTFYRGNYCIMGIRERRQTDIVFFSFFFPPKIPPRT